MPCALSTWPGVWRKHNDGSGETLDPRKGDVKTVNDAITDVVRAAALDLVRAARAFDGTHSGAAEAEAMIMATAPDLPLDLLASIAAWLGRKIADRASGDVDGLITSVERSIREGRLAASDSPRNLSRSAARVMQQFLNLARANDDLARTKLAEVYGAREDLIDLWGIAFAGVQFIRAIADLTGDAEAALDVLACELLDTQLRDGA